MRSAFYCLAVFFFLILVSTPLRFAYAAAPQTDPLAGTESAIENGLHSISASLAAPLHDLPPPNISTIANTGRQALQTIVVAASHAVAQAASAWGAWVALANSDLTSKVKVASIPATAAIIVSQTGANAPPITAPVFSALPTPHLRPLAGASSGQSISTLTPPTDGAVLGTNRGELRHPGRTQRAD